jgi:hypothetical protein
MTGFKSKRQAAQVRVVVDDAQGYIADYEAALKIAYEIGFENGKKAQRKPLTLNAMTALEEKVYMQTTHKGKPSFEYAQSLIRATEAAHGIKEGT